MFKLNIECSKDFDELHIVFADGSSMVTTQPSPPKTQKQTKPKARDKNIQHQKPKKKEEFLDIDADFSNVSQDVVELPNISDERREVKVADELQNFEL